MHSPYQNAGRSNREHFFIAVNIRTFKPLTQFNVRMTQ
jgi:hypothetical protein